MDQFFDIPTLIVIGLAIVVLYRLRQVLGTRTGNERTPAQRQREVAAAKPGEENVVQMRPRPVPQSNEDQERYQRKLEAEITQFAHGDEAVAAGLKAIAEADPAFSPKSFMEGAKAAYEMIVTAFASGDRQTLRNLLEKDVFDGFEKVIKDREAAGRKVEVTFVGLPKVEISEAELDKRNANVTIRFHAEVVSATRDKDGALIEGNADQVTNIADEWTFARNPKSRDPNWKLVATSQLE
ncbi:MAG: Tim44 domain-containing protein [Devosia sp.]|uniref:Tim44/TimA family putative adaptor protein n=1 Tax=Devosia sp. TaxID=1871048 RepID=UPI001AC5E6EC|nr:Tim44/TimA family putative adaptor protein [Devosia sp.]MBN9315947.1 Tim44 domain-containing protein [Devosia sp.]